MITVYVVAKSGSTYAEFPTRQQAEQFLRGDSWLRGQGYLVCERTRFR